MLFPGWRVVSDPLPPFIAENQLVVISERTKDPYPSKSTIQITHRADVKLDSREGFIRFLQSRGVKITEDHQKDLSSLEDTDFWPLAKLMYITGKYEAPEVARTGSIFQLFKGLFDSYAESYKSFRYAGVSHKQAFSSLLTMMLKTQHADTITASPFYKKALLANKLYYGYFQKAVLNYLDSEMKEPDFLALLLECSSVKRGQ